MMMMNNKNKIQSNNNPNRAGHGSRGATDVQRRIKQEIEAERLRQAGQTEVQLSPEKERVRGGCLSGGEESAGDVMTVEKHFRGKDNKWTISPDNHPMQPVSLIKPADVQTVEDNSRSHSRSVSLQEEVDQRRRNHLKQLSVSLEEDKEAVLDKKRALESEKRAEVKREKAQEEKARRVAAMVKEGTVSEEGGSEKPKAEKSSKVGKKKKSKAVEGSQQQTGTQMKEKSLSKTSNKSDKSKNAHTNHYPAEASQATTNTAVKALPRTYRNRPSTPTMEESHSIEDPRFHRSSKSKKKRVSDDRLVQLPDGEGLCVLTSPPKRRPGSQVVDPNDQCVIVQTQTEVQGGGTGDGEIDQQENQPNQQDRNPQQWSLRQKGQYAPPRRPAGGSFVRDFAGAFVAGSTLPEDSNVDGSDQFIPHDSLGPARSKSLNVTSREIAATLENAAPEDRQKFQRDTISSRLKMVDSSGGSSGKLQAFLAARAASGKREAALAVSSQPKGWGEVEVQAESESPDAAEAGLSIKESQARERGNSKSASETVSADGPADEPVEVVDGEKSTHKRSHSPTPRSGDPLAKKRRTVTESSEWDKEVAMPSLWKASPLETHFTLDPVEDSEQKATRARSLPGVGRTSAFQVNQARQHKFRTTLLPRSQYAVAPVLKLPTPIQVGDGSSPLELPVQADKVSKLFPGAKWTAATRTASVGAPPTATIVTKTSSVGAGSLSVVNPAPFQLGAGIHSNFSTTLPRTPLLTSRPVGLGFGITFNKAAPVTTLPVTDGAAVRTSSVTLAAPQGVTKFQTPQPQTRAVNTDAVKFFGLSLNNLSFKNFKASNLQSQTQSHRIQSLPGVGLRTSAASPCDSDGSQDDSRWHLSRFKYEDPQGPGDEQQFTKVQASVSITPVQPEEEAEAEAIPDVPEEEEEQEDAPAEGDKVKVSGGNHSRVTIPHLPIRTKVTPEFQGTDGSYTQRTPRVPGCTQTAYSSGSQTARGGSVRGPGPADDLTFSFGRQGLERTLSPPKSIQLEIPRATTLPQCQPPLRLPSPTSAQELTHLMKLTHEQIGLSNNPGDSTELTRKRTQFQALCASKAAQLAGISAEIESILISTRFELKGLRKKYEELERQSQNGIQEQETKDPEDVKNSQERIASLKSQRVQCKKRNQIKLRELERRRQKLEAEVSILGGADESLRKRRVHELTPPKLTNLTASQCHQPIPGPQLRQFGRFPTPRNEGATSSLRDHELGDVEGMSMSRGRSCPEPVVRAPVDTESGAEPAEPEQKETSDPEPANSANNVDNQAAVPKMVPAPATIKGLAFPQVTAANRMQFAVTSFSQRVRAVLQDPRRQIGLLNPPKGPDGSVLTGNLPSTPGFVNLLNCKTETVSERTVTPRVHEPPKAVGLGDRTSTPTPGNLITWAASPGGENGAPNNSEERVPSVSPCELTGVVPSTGEVITVDAHAVVVRSVVKPDSPGATLADLQRRCRMVEEGKESKH